MAIVIKPMSGLCHSNPLNIQTLTQHHHQQQQLFHSISFSLAFPRIIFLENFFSPTPDLKLPQVLIFSLENFGFLKLSFGYRR